MAVFTAAATYLVTSFFGATFAATIAGTIVTSVVAAGIATVTSRIINGGGSGASGGGTQQDPGVRIQLPPATDNKVPVIYGTVNTKSICVDARISDDNQQMTYVLVLGEKTQTGTFTVGDVYWNDEKLVFDTGSNNYKVASSIDQNGLGQSSTNLGGLIEMRVFAGSAQNSANQIFPSTNKVSAASYVGETTSTYQLNDLVYAVVKLTYSGEKGVTNLQQMTFEVINSLSNPGLVLYDYLTSGRYGAGIDSAQIDTLSMISTVTNTSLYSISNEIPPNQFESNGTTPSTQARYVINGVLSTGETVKNNLEKITQACASWLTYDYGQGKWSVIVNRALGVSELASVVTYDDDSIVGEVSVNATNIEDLYNSIEVEFPSREIRDQNDYYRASTTSTERNNYEPDNTLSLRYDLINNSIHAQRLGLIELNQSRVDRTIQFKTDYSGLQTQAGDVIKIVNEVYGFEDSPAKLFRVTRVREVENEDGGLFAEITGLEYSASVYGDTSITDYQPNTASGIPSFGGPTALPAPGVVAFNQVFTATNQPYFTVQTIIDPTSGPIDRILWYYSTSPTGTSLVYITDEVGPFFAGQTVTDSIVGLPQGTYYLYARAVKDGATSNPSADGIVNMPPIVPPYTGYTHGIDWSPQPGGVNNGTISTATFSNQVQITNTTTGLYSFALTTGTGYQRVYGDVDITYSPSANSLNVGGGVVANRTISAGGYPLNSASTASWFLSQGVSPAMAVTNWTSGVATPVIALRGYGQNNPGGGAASLPNPSLRIESSRGTNTAPTAILANQNLGGIIVGGYDGANWPSDQSTAYNLMNWFATEDMTNDGSTSTYRAGSGFGIFVQPAWTRPGINATRQRFLFTNWATTSSTGPTQLNLSIGSGADGFNPTMTMVDGTTYTGYGRTNFAINNAQTAFFGVPTTDTAPDNNTLTGTNFISIISGRRSGTAGRRNQIQINDNLGGLQWRSQSVSNNQGNGNQNIVIQGIALDTQAAGAQGARLTISTVNTATTTLGTRMTIDNRLMTYAADQHQFSNGGSTNIPLSFTTSTWNASVDTQTFANTAGTVNMLTMNTTNNDYRNTTHVFKDRTGSFTALTVTTATTTVSGALNAPGTYHCEVARSSDQSLTNDSDVVVQFNKTNSDPQSWYNSGTYRITPTVSGYYLVQVQVIWGQGTGASTDQQNIQIRKNGSTFAISQEELYTGSVAMTQNAVGVVQLNGSSDYIDVTGYNGGSASQPVRGSTNGEWTKVTLTKLQ